MSPPTYSLLSKAEVVLINRDQINQHGGSLGFQNEGMIDSALGAVENALVYQEMTLFEIAAKYGYKLIKNHGFSDGSKRTGMASALTFLEKNGWLIRADTRSLVDIALDVANDRIDEIGFGQWLKEHAEEVFAPFIFE